MLLFQFVAFIVHPLIFCLHFSQKQSANQPKKIQGNVLLLDWKAQAKIHSGTLEGKKIHLTKPFNFLPQDYMLHPGRSRGIQGQIYIDSWELGGGGYSNGQNIVNKSLEVNIWNCMHQGYVYWNIMLLVCSFAVHIIYLQLVTKAKHVLVSEWFRKLYEWTKLPLVPLYGGFPVKLRCKIW